MQKYFKAVWSGNITRRYLEDFTKHIEQKWNLKSATTSQWQTEYGDFNGDHKQDILISYWGTNQDNGKRADKPADGQLVLLLGDGANGFKDGTRLLPNQGRLNAMTMNSAVADFNKDGSDDIILTLHNEDGRSNPAEFPVEQYAFFSNENGRFKPVDLDLNTWGRQSFTGDFNHDGRLDFAVQGWTVQKDGSDTAFYLRGKDGSYTRHMSGDAIGGNVTVSGDFDGDGKTEVAAFTSQFREGAPAGFFSHLYEFDDEGGIRKQITNFDKVYRTAYTDDTFGGNRTMVGINRLPNGKEYYDDGIHFADTGDINGDGADDIVALHYALDFKNLSNGRISITKNHYMLQAFTAAGGDGLEDMKIKVKGWTPGFVADIHLVDWNGDGHLDIFVPWEGFRKDGTTEAERVFLNDGKGNFERLPQKFLPTGTNNWGTEYGDYTDANRDGIMDVLIRPQGYDVGDNKWQKFSETLYLGTKRIFGDGTTHNPAKDGAAGFNEAYYLSQLDHAKQTLTAGNFQSALEHYLAVGKAEGIYGFAAGTHVYGYNKAETITLREGNETAHGFGGNDILIGAAGADILNGGRGRDTFVYQSIGDSGVTTDTRDIIEDFASGQDHIDVSGIDAKSVTAENDTFTFLAQENVSFTGAGGELRFTRETGSHIVIIEGDVDGDKVADFQIELQDVNGVSASDLVL